MVAEPRKNHGVVPPPIALIDAAVVIRQNEPGLDCWPSLERELIHSAPRAGLQAAGERGRKGGRKFALTKGQVRLAQAAMGKRGTVVNELCAELGITRTTLYRHVGPNGELRNHGKRVLGR